MTRRSIFLSLEKRKSGPEEESETEKREKRSRFETLDGDIGGGGGGEKW